MFSKSLLKEIIADQASHKITENYIPRTVFNKIESLEKNKEILVISGIRRCGKSTVLQQIRHQHTHANYYLNFEDERLINFTVSDFQLLLETFIELFNLEKTFYFDEIQNIPEWERFVRRLYNEGNKIYITGSNATLLSKELGTRLTGRYIPIEMYPYSFREFVTYQQSKLLNSKNYNTQEKGQLARLFIQYQTQGGIPDYVKYGQLEYLQTLYQSIIYRDIIARYKLPNEKSIKELVFYLASHIGKEVTFNSLRKLLNLGSTSTVSDYCSYLENSYLIFFINRYALSLKKQISHAKKVYFIDHALAHAVGFRFSEDSGRTLENIIFMQLKRLGKEVYFHKENFECDFIIKTGFKITEAIQVCLHMDSEKTKQREYRGLLEAMEAHNLKDGLIITENLEQEEVINFNNKKYNIKIISAWRWLLES